MNSKCFLSGLLTIILTIIGCDTPKQLIINNSVSLERAKATLDSLYQVYSVPGTYLLRENYPIDLHSYTETYIASEEEKYKPNQYCYLWPYTGTFSATNAILAATNDSTYKIRLEQKILPGLEKYFDNRRTPEAYASYIREAPLSDRFYDDNVWVGIDFTDAYLYSQQNKYLQKAKLVWRFIESGMDDKMNGGIYWSEQKKKSKNACSSASGSVFAFKLYQATQDKYYFEKGRELYEWTKTHLQDSLDHLYFDNISLNGVVNKAKFAYNSGQMMQAAALLYQITGQQEYLTESQRIAESCHKYFFINYTPKEGPPFKLIKKGDVWFTAIMLRGYVELYHLDRNKTYLESFKKSLDHAWLYARDEKGLFNTDFSGKTRDQKKWLLTQAAMAEMYARLAIQ